MSVDIILVPWQKSVSNNNKGIQLDIEDISKIKIHYINNIVNHTNLNGYFAIYENNIFGLFKYNLAIYIIMNNILIEVSHKVEIKWFKYYLFNKFIIIKDNNIHTFKYNKLWWYFFRNPIVTLLDYYIDLWDMNDWQLVCDLPNNVYCSFKNGILRESLDNIKIFD